MYYKLTPISEEPPPLGEEEVEHKWIIGEWHRELGDRYLSRSDKCELCDCERNYIKVFKKKPLAPEIILVGYDRSGILFSHDNMPQCWGAKNPQ